MYWLFWSLLILAVFLILLFIVLSSTATLRLNVHVEFKNSYAILQVRMLFGLIRRRYELPFDPADIQINPEHESAAFDPYEETETADGMRGEKRMGWTKLRLRDYRLLMRATDGFRDWLLQTMSRVKLTGILWSSSFALDDAAETASAAGVLWTLKHTVLGWLSFHLQLCAAPELSVLPDFNGPPQFSSTFHCTAKISLWKMALSGMGLLVRVLKVKGGIRAWRTTLSKGMS